MIALQLNISLSSILILLLVFKDFHPTYGMFIYVEQWFLTGGASIGSAKFIEKGGRSIFKAVISLLFQSQGAH